MPRHDYSSPFDSPDPHDLNDLDITDDLTITGAGQAITNIDGGGIDRVFDVKLGNTLEISGVTVQNGNVISFNEKSISGPGWINNGHYIFRKEAFEGYNGAFSLEKDLFPNLLKNNALAVFEVKNDKFIDMGIPSSYEKLKRRILKL